MVDSSTISLELRNIAANPSLETEISPYKQESTFISEVKEPGFKFTTLAIAWEQSAPTGTNIELQARFQVQDTWSEWVTLDAEDDFSYNPSLKTEKKFGTASSNLATAAQYKVIMQGNGEISPYIKNQEITFLKTAKYELPELPEAIFSALSAEEMNDISAVSSSELISRSNWGAEESYRYLSDNTSTPQLIDLSDDFYEKYGDELTVARVVEQDEQGNRYKWPLKYPQEVEKIIIHHTATTSNLDNPAQAIRDIYYYHSVSRGWGDIGYNYILDKEGRLYEGRYGDEGVIAAHAGPGNHGSIGIAVLGNYDTNAVPEPVLVTLSELIYQKSKIHGFSPEGYSEFRDEVMPNIFGHEEVMSTSCPGDNMIEQLPALRIMSQNAFEDKEKFITDYDFQDLSDIFYIQMKPEESRELVFELENIGNESWNSQTNLDFSIDQDSLGYITLPDINGKSEMFMEESEVEPGEIGTFKLKVKSWRKGGTIQLNFVLKPNDSNKDLDEIKIPLTIEQPIYKYEIKDFSTPGEAIKVGENFSGELQLKNLGNIVWENEGDKHIYIQGTYQGISAELVESSVSPGETGTFKYSFTASGEIGTYYEQFLPIMEDVIWSPGDDINFSSNIYEKEYDGEVFSKTSLLSAEKGVRHKLSVQLRNLGSQSWSEEDLKLLFLKNPDVYISELSMNPKTIQIGETTKLEFKLKPANSAQENQLLYIQPKIDGFPIIRRPIRYEFKVTDPVVSSTKITSTNSDKIRIKLSINQDSEITASTNFSLYSGTSFLEELSAGEVVEITEESGLFEIETPGKSYEKSGPVRLETEEGGLLEIVNFENRPSWNLDLNDNLYRDTLEIDYLDGEVVVINELPLEYYLRGVAEISNNEEPEKIKALMVAARSYSHYYMTIDEKFPGEP
ncbi:hypothetical protein HN499_03310, partial [archaeon]|nr:hypothetical protein [archaeon]